MTKKKVPTQKRERGEAESKKKKDYPSRIKTQKPLLSVKSIIEARITDLLIDDKTEKMIALCSIKGKNVYVHNIHDTLNIGDIIALKLVQKHKKTWQGEFVRRVVVETKNIGVYSKHTHSIHPIHYKDLFPPLPFFEPLEDGMVVVFEESLNNIKILEHIGLMSSPKIFSRIAALENDVWKPITKEEEKACESFTIPPLGNRKDYRDIPFVTIDGEDAKDFDDAVYAKSDTSSTNVGGYHIFVAIADVTYYVAPESILDKHAIKRGNSVYFPDFVVPMLPEKLSNDLCSLRPDCDRGCVVAEMTITATGKVIDTKFQRGLMKSHARLTYHEVEKMIRGHYDNTRKFLKPHINSLYSAYKILKKARDKRGSLKIQSTEHEISFHPKSGSIKTIKLRKTLNSHQLIEEMMVLANVAVAEGLKAKGYPCLYRTHPAPADSRLLNLKTFTKMLKIPFTNSKNPTPHDFNALLSSVQNTGFENVINDLILRCQGQAYYSTANVGHYGLGLSDYCHFTSPIRRYADVIIHHLLIDAYKLGKNKVKTFDLENIGKAVSKTERQAVASERYATERFLAHFLKDKKGSIFDAVITGVMQSGLFVTVKGLQAEGFIPKRILQQRFPKENSTYFDQGKMILRIGKKTFQLGQEHKVVLIESNPETCSITFQMVE